MILRAVINTAFFLIFTFGSIVALKQGTSEYLTISDALSWEQTTAKVLKLDVVYENTRRGVMYTPNIHYSFPVDGYYYEGKKLTLTTSRNISYSEYSSALNAGKSFLDTIDQSTVNVFYNPLNPEESVIDRGEKNFTIIIIGFVFLLLAIIMGITASRTIRQLRNKIKEESLVNPAHSEIT